jgi:hypothetical protein
VITTLPRLVGCGAWRRPDAEAVLVGLDEHGEAHLAGVQSCGSVWACPVCSASIRQGRSVQVQQAALAHLAAGGGLAFVTLTVPHDRGDALAELLDGVIVGWNAIRKHRGVKRASAAAGGWSDYIRAVEITDGVNGWHPHLHVLLFLERPGEALALKALESAMHAAWSAFAVSRGRRAPALGIGVRLQAVSNDSTGAATLASYLTKIQDEDGVDRALGLEMARGDLKSGRGRGSMHPFELIDRARAGDRRAIARWREYEQATKGRRCIEWSRSLKKRYDIGSDENLATPDPTALLPVHRFNELDWALVCRNRAQWRVLVAAEDYGSAGVERVLKSLLYRESRAHTHRRYGARDAPGLARDNP